MNRRAFLKAGACTLGVLAAGGAVRAFAGEGDALRPPGGSDETVLLGACIHCDRCRSVCPRGCIRLATLEAGLLKARTPILDFQRGYCDFCGKCIEACPTQALRPCGDEMVRLGVAVLDREECANCKKCLPACEYEAITWDDVQAIPVIDDRTCNGCGKCEYVCPSASYGYYAGARVRAIHVVKG